MEDKVLKTLTDKTEQIYASMMSQVKNGYYSIWNPRFQELNTIMEALIVDYSHCTKGKVLSEHYDKLVEYAELVKVLPQKVFDEGDFGAMSFVQEELPKELAVIKESMERGLSRYEQVEARVSKVYEYEKEFISASSNLIIEYKSKLRNRIQQNIAKVRQFESLSETDRRYFMTHVILFDEGKIENTILEYLNEAERKAEEEATEVEKKAIISPVTMDAQQARAYVHQYRRDVGKVSPKELSISRKLLKEGEIENKFESWFNSLMGESSSVGQLINEGKQSYELPMEEQMFEAIENVVDSNLNDLKMTEMIDAYKEECADIKEKSFVEFYGNYEEIKNLVFIIDKAIKLFPNWEMREVSIADIILGEY